MPQLAVAVVGAELGATALGTGIVALGMTGAQIGFAAGSLLGGMLFAPTQKTQGPRLADLKAAQVAYGSVIPYVEGHPRLAGVIVWASVKREISTTTSQGKGGGGESTTFTYEQDVMFELAENVLPGVRRIWKNGELVWTEGQTTAEHWDEMLFYDGNSSQLPDPTYEAAVGVGNAPAYRTRTTAVLRGVKLGSSGQLPNFTFEVGPSALKVRPGTVISLWNFGATGSLVLPPYPVVVNPVSTADKNDLSELVSPNTWTLVGHNGDLAFIDATGLVLPEQGSPAFACGVFREDNHALTLSGDFTLEYRHNPENHTWAGAGGTFYIMSSVASGGTSPTVSGEFQLIKVEAGAVQQLLFSYLDGATMHTVTSGAVSYQANSVNEVSIQRRGTSLIMSIGGAVVGTTSCGTADLTLVVFYLGGRNGGDHLVPNDFASGLYTAMRMTTGLARYTGSYTTGQPWTLDGSSIDTTTYSSEPTIQEVVERQCTRAGLDLAFVDASALATRNLHAMVISQLSSPRTVIEMLMTAYAFQAVESDVLRFSWRGAAPVATIAFDELIAADQPFPITKGNDLELPVQVFVKYMNIDDDYQDGNESSDRMVSGGLNTSQVEFPLGLRPTEAKRIADFQVTDAVASNFRFGPFGLDRSYSRLEPSDVINVISQDGLVTFRVRLNKKTEAGGILTFEGVSDDAAVLASVLHTSLTGQTNSTEVRLPVDTVLALMDCPLLADADDGPGFYADVKALTDVSFPGAALFKSDDNVTFANVGASAAAGVFGTASTVLGSGPLGVFDEGHVVTVDVGFGQLASSTRDVLLAGNTNMMLLGSEVIQFRDAALLTPGVYTLSGLLRGRRGTEWAIGTHVAGEAAVLLDSAVQHVGLSNSELGIAKYYKGVTLGRTTATASSQAFTANGVSSKPFAVVDVRKSDAGGGTFALTWRRRTRFGSRFLGPLSSSVPLGEASEAYAVDVLNGSNVLQSTQTVTTNAATVTATSGWKARVYQLSATVGRGYVAEITI